jgi:hypothetical protein
LPAAADKLGRILRHLTASSQSRALADVMAACGQPCGVEMSFRLRPGRIDAGRFLLTQARDVIAPQEDNLWSGLGRLGLDTTAVRDEARSAEFIHLGYEHGADPVCKVYAEFGTDGAEVSPLVHLAWKWRPGSPGSLAKDEYRLIDAAQVQGVLSGASSGAGGPVAGEAAAWVARHVADLTSIFALHVTSAASQRASVDLRLYQFGLQVGALASMLEGVAGRLGVPQLALDEALHEAGRDRLGHLAFGESRDGEPFVTVYGGMTMIEPVPLS